MAGWLDKYPHKADNGTSITPQDRQKWNEYQSSLTSAPGQYVRNWNGNQDFQKQTAQSVGYDYSKNAAIQNDMMHNQSQVSGIQANDAWGGNPNIVGGRESQKRYIQPQQKQYEYQHLDAKGQQIGHIAPSTTALTGDQFNSWTNSNYNTQQPITPIGNSPVNKPMMSNNPAPQVAMNKPKKNTANMYTGAPADDYSIDSVRSGVSYEFSKGGKIKMKKAKYY